MEKSGHKTILRENLWSISLRLTAVMLFILPSCHAYGGWELVTTSSRGDAYYLDSATETKSGMSYVWSLVDLSKAIEGSKSVKRLYQFDCVKGKFRVEQRLAYADKGGQGQLTSVEKTAGQWMYPDPESINEKLVLKICFDKKENTLSTKK